MSKLLARTKELLEQRTINELAEIAQATGLPFSWIHSVRYKDINPSIDRVEKLYEHLSGHQLEVK